MVALQTALMAVLGDFSLIFMLIKPNSWIDKGQIRCETLLGRFFGCLGNQFKNTKPSEWSNQ